SGPCFSPSVAGHPLRPASHQSLGGPLPRQLANGAQAPPRVMACKQRPSFTAGAETPVGTSGISPPFGRLSQARGWVTYVLLTRAPLYSGSCPPFLARLACIRHAASVRSEPGSNSPVEPWSTSPPDGQRGVTHHTMRPDLASTTNRAVRSITLGTFSAN